MSILQMRSWHIVYKFDSEGTIEAVIVSLLRRAILGYHMVCTTNIYYI